LEIDSRREQKISCRGKHGQAAKPGAMGEFPQFPPAGLRRPWGEFFDWRRFFPVQTLISINNDSEGFFNLNSFLSRRVEFQSLPEIDKIIARSVSQNGKPEKLDATLKKLLIR